MRRFIPTRVYVHYHNSRCYKFVTSKEHVDIRDWVYAISEFNRAGELLETKDGMSGTVTNGIIVKLWDVSVT